MTENAVVQSSDPVLSVPPAGPAASMTNGKLKAALWAELVKQAHLFEAVRTLQPAFEPHATVLSVLGVLTNEDLEGYSEKEKLTRAILREHQAHLRRAQRTPLGSYWTTLLLAAFYPMLVRIRFAITADAVERDDLDQVVIEAFLDVASSLPLEGRRMLALRLKNRTRRAVFGRVNAERRDRRTLSELAAAPPSDDVMPDPQEHRSAAAAAENEMSGEQRIDRLLSHVGGSIEQAHLDLVIATAIRGERLWTIVNRQNPGLSYEERARLYERVKRQHSRTLARLQNLLRGIDFSCPGPHAGGLLPIQRSDSKEAR